MSAWKWYLSKTFQFGEHFLSVVKTILSNPTDPPAASKVDSMIS